MAAIWDLVNFHRFKNAIPFFSHHYYVSNGNKQKKSLLTNILHQKYIRAYTIGDKRANVDTVTHGTGYLVITWGFFLFFIST